MKNLLIFFITLVMAVPGLAQTKFIINPFWTVPQLLLDSVTTNAWAAYSITRKLKSNYVGNAFKVIRTSDATEQDIGFIVSGATDTASLLSFVGSANGFISAVYDQTGNARHLNTFPCSPITNCAPIIVSGGTLQTDNNGKPVAFANVTLTGKDIGISASGSPGLPFTAFLITISVTHTNNMSLVNFGAADFGTVNQGVIGTVTDSGNNRFRLLNNTSAGVYLTDSNNYSTGTQYLLSYYLENGSSDFIQLDWNTAVTGQAGDRSISVPTIGAGSSGGDNNCAESKFSEWAIWNKALSASDQTTIKQNMSQYYGIVVP